MAKCYVQIKEESEPWMIEEPYSLESYHQQLLQKFGGHRLLVIDERNDMLTVRAPGGLQTTLHKDWINHE